MNKPTGGHEELPEISPTSTARKSDEANMEATNASVNRAHATGHGVRNQVREVPTPFVWDIKNAVAAGIFASIIFTILWYPLVFITGEDSLDLALVFGAFITPQLDWLTRILGLGALIGTYTAIAVTYMALLFILRLRSNAGKGAVFGFMVFAAMTAFILPWLVGFLARFGVSHASLPQPDALLNQAGHSNYGWEVMVAGLAAHLMYGAIVGALYREKPRETVESRPFRVEYAGG